MMVGELKIFPPLTNIFVWLANHLNALLVIGIKKHMSVEILVSLSSPRYFLTRCNVCGDMTYFDGEIYRTYERAERATEEWKRNHLHG